MKSNRATIIKAIDDKKGKDIVEIDFAENNGSICDAYIICSATSNSHTDAISNEIDKQMREIHKEKPIRMGGKEDGLWIILDYGDVMVHIFEEQTRKVYALERLWSGAKITNHRSSED
ncbi:MAG: ribosome silencing factor [Bacteroidetes bacterium]|nr:ribosome silencing factor [Bacteroidota bacterium]